MPRFDGRSFEPIRESRRLFSVRDHDLNPIEMS